MYEVEQPFDCPHCGSPITVFLDPSEPEQTYIEDCEVCCRPIELSYRADDGEITAFIVSPVEQ